MVRPFGRGYLSSDNSAVSCMSFLSLRLEHSDFLHIRTEIGQVFSPESWFSTRTHRGLFDGLIWPKTGCASIV